MAEPRVRTELLPTAQDALQGYLDSLLREATRAPVLRAVPERGAPQPAAAAAPAPAAVPAREGAAVDDATPGRAAGSPPDWARDGFQALLFNVGSLRLAVPLVRLHGVLPWPEAIAAMPGQPSWSLGLMRHRDRNVRVVDTATLVGVPGDGGQRPVPSNVLIVGDGEWALAADSISDVLHLEPGEVKWRSAQGRRPWLAGTLLERLCALMDTDAFAGMLAAGRNGGRAPPGEGRGRPTMGAGGGHRAEGSR